MIEVVNMTLTKAFTKDMEGQTPTHTGAIRQIPTVHHVELVVYIFECGIPFVQASCPAMLRVLWLPSHALNVLCLAQTPEDVLSAQMDPGSLVLSSH